MSGEFDARLLHYWSHIRSALKRGNLIEAAEWLESAAVEEGVPTMKALQVLSGKLCRGEIEK